VAVVVNVSLRLGIGRDSEALKRLCNLHAEASTDGCVRRAVIATSETGKRPTRERSKVKSMTRGRLGVDDV
jgi:hypothetical protein